MTDAEYQVLYQECGWPERSGKVYATVLLERWSINTTCRYIATCGYKQLTDYGEEWVGPPIPILLDVTTDAAAIRYAIRAYDAVRADLYAKPKGRGGH